jgi:uncharacterized protein (DUF952 family)
MAPSGLPRALAVAGAGKRQSNAPEHRRDLQLAHAERAMTIVYKICRAAEWDEAVRAGAYRGSPVDLGDGYIHFSTAEQVAATAAKHFAGQHDLLLVAVDPAALGPALKWEPSRGGALFPHLYADLPVSAALWVKPLPLDDQGRHVFPGL